MGFGDRDVWATTRYGVKRVVDVPLASAHPKFGADAELEFVRGGCSPGLCRGRHSFTDWLRAFPG